jgi:hypothetical protein
VFNRHNTVTVRNFQNIILAIIGIGGVEGGEGARNVSAAVCFQARFESGASRITVRYITSA